MTLSQNAYFYVDHEKMRNVIYLRKGATLDLISLQEMIAKDRSNIFKGTTFIELGDDIERISDDVILERSCKNDGRLRLYEESENRIYFLRFCSQRNAFLVWEFTKEPFTHGVVRINFPHAHQLSITSVQCVKVKTQDHSLHDTFFADA